MDDIFSQRLDRLRETFSGADIDALLVFSDENRYYLSGFSARDGQCDESAGAVVVGPSRQLIATDSRYESQAQNETSHFDIVCYREGLAKALPEIIKSLHITRLGFESTRLPYYQFERIHEQLKSLTPTISLVPSQGLVEGLRVRKDAQETDAITESLRIAESVLSDILRQFPTTATEQQIAWEIEKAMRERGAEAMAFSPIVASGPNAALPHAVPSNRLISDGGPLLFDWGCRLNGYCSDISRTIWIGPPDDRFHKVFQTVLAAQQLAIEAIKPGISSQAVDKVARDHIAAQGFAGHFGHGLGHGVGLATHEKPHLSPFKPTTLEAGMVTTVEPGIYLPGWGGVRLENMVVVETDGARVMNTLPLELTPMDRC